VGQELTPAQREQLHRRFAFANAGLVKVERLAGNVGYLRLDAFAPPEEAGPRIAAAMSLLADTGALIIDLRSNGGGWPLTVSLLISYLLPAEREEHLHDIYSRLDGTHQYWTSIEVSGKRYLGKPVYVLTSTRTFSAAEGFAYDVQALRRATIVGEVTGGGAHPSLVEKLDTHFLLIVPESRVINTVTRTDWEGTGVKPDVSAPADRALDAAHLVALDRVKATIDSRLEPDAAKEIDEAIAKLRPATK
jgi:C-terminal processing protease CtpA/Prc